MCVQPDRRAFVDEMFSILAADALAGVEFSLVDWSIVLKAYQSGFSLRAPWCAHEAQHQIASLASCVDDDDLTDHSLDLARRIEALPTRQKIAILDVIDRYFAPRGVVLDDFQDDLESLGIVFADTAYARLRAAAARA